MSKGFKRSDVSRHSKLGKSRRKLVRWVRPTGRHNKMRLKRKSYPKVVSVGYKSPKSESGKINGNDVVLISNHSDVEKIGKDTSAILSRRLGAKKKLELIKKLEEKKIKVLNLAGDKK